MNFFKLADKYAKKMRWYDISLVKVAVFSLTMFLVTAWQGFRNVVLGIGWYWYLIIFVIVMIPLCKKMFYD